MHPPPDLQSLPLAAALHPKRMRQLTELVSLTADATLSGLDGDSGMAKGVPQLMTARLVTEAESSKILSDALRRAAESRIKLKAQLDIAQKNSAATIPPRKDDENSGSTSSHITDVTLKLWTPRKARLHGLHVSALVRVLTIGFSYSILREQPLRLHRLAPAIYRLVSITFGPPSRRRCHQYPIPTSLVARYPCLPSFLAQLSDELPTSPRLTAPVVLILNFVIDEFSVVITERTV